MHIGLKFLIKGFDDEDFQQVLAQVQGLGGKLVSEKFSGIVDYAVVPILGTELKCNAKQIVTNLFVVSIFKQK